MTKISPEGHRIKEGATYSSSNSGEKRKITNEQAERAYELLKDGIGMTARRNAEREALIAEIEAANQPPEIRWCVRHEVEVPRISKCCLFVDGKECAEASIHEGTCEIWVYRPERKE